MATIDVLLPVRNGLPYLAESIDSIRNQTFADWRLLLLDHGSTDGSRELAGRYAEQDSRIQLVSRPEAKGLAGLLNHGLELADCRYVMRHDADDVCYPDRMDITLRAFREQAGCAAIGGQVDVIDAEGAPIGAMNLPIGPLRVTASSFFRNPVAHPAATFDFDAVQGLGIRYGKDLLNVLPADSRPLVDGLAEDYFMFGQLALLGRCSNVGERLIRYRWHGGNVGATRRREQILLSLAISRFLAQSFTARHALPCFDPAPFCNLGDALFDVDGAVDFADEFEAMAAALRRGIGETAEVEREIAFRRVVSTRRRGSLLWRYLQFTRAHVPDSGERNAVRSWIMNGLPGKVRFSVSSVRCT